MESIIAPHGLIADLITPLRSDGSIDGRGLGRHLDRLAPSSQAILLASPHAGEGKNLTRDQRLELLEKALVVIRGRIPVLIWISHYTEDKTRDTIVALKNALKRRRYAGPVFWVDSPLYYHSNRGLPAYYRSICSEFNAPFILLNDPELIKGLDKPLKRNNIRTAVLKELTKLENIVGLIFFGSIDRAHNYHRACRRHDHFRVYDGDETRFLEHPSMSGVVSVGANLAPQTWQKITQSSLQLTGDKRSYPDYLRQVWELGVYLRNLKDLYQQMPVAVIKEILSDMGVIESSTCTFPTENWEEPERRIKELMARYGDYPQNKL